MATKRKNLKNRPSYFILHIWKIYDILHILQKLSPSYQLTLYQDCTSHHDLSKNMGARGQGLFSDIENCHVIGRALGR